MGNTTINNFVAERISKELGDKILSKTLKPITENTYFYISNIGKDETADGSENKPFRKLNTCLEYIYKNYYICWISKTIRIKFLTDYTEEDDIVYLKSILGNQGSNSQYLIIDLNNKNVILSSLFAERGTTNFMNGSLIVNSKGTTTYNLYSNNFGLLAFNCPIKITIDNNVTNSTLAVNSSITEFYETVEFNFNSVNSIDKLLQTAYQGRMRFHKPITLTGTDTTFKQCFAQSLHYGLLAFDSSATISNNITVTGKRYDASFNGTIVTNGKGTNFLPGTENGIWRTSLEW